jgi:hypothetical protein
MVSPLDGSSADSAESSQLHGMRLEAEHAGHRFVIEHDPAVGYYVYAFEDARCTRDHLQDSLELAKECAREEFGVPEDAWHEASPTI